MWRIRSADRDINSGEGEIDSEDPTQIIPRTDILPIYGESSGEVILFTFRRNLELRPHCH